MTRQAPPEVAYWFAAEPKLPHGDGRPVIIGKTHTAKGKLRLCQNGLHWSARPLDALEYAKGSLLYRVRPGGAWLMDGEKGCSRSRTYLAMRDATAMLRSFARAEALRVIHLWDAPEVVRQYLETGDESLRAAVAGAVAGAVARAATWDAVKGSARAAARAAAARDAARAARDAAWGGASAAARGDARAATWGDARAAAWDAASAVAGAIAGAVARAAAWDAARAAAKERFAAAVDALFAEPAP